MSHKYAFVKYGNEVRKYLTTRVSDRLTMRALQRAVRHSIRNNLKRFTLAALTRLQFSGTWRRLIWWIVTIVSKESAATIFGFPFLRHIHQHSHTRPLHNTNLEDTSIRSVSKIKLKLSLYRPWRPIGLWDVEAPTFSRQSAHTWWQDYQLCVPAAFYPQEDSWYSFLSEAIVRLEGLGQLEKKIHLIRDSNLRPSSL
jgi:hypothetical protein